MHYTTIGVSIIPGDFNIGHLASAICRSDDLATEIVWLTNGVTLKSNTSIYQLDLTFSLVNDSIHNSVYVCRVFRANSSAEQNFTVRVDGEKQPNYCIFIQIYILL